MDLEAKKPESLLSRYGQPAWVFGRYELTRLWGAVWPMILAGVANYFMSRSTDLTAAGSTSLGIMVGAVSKIVTQCASNNTGKKT